MMIIMIMHEYFSRILLFSGSCLRYVYNNKRKLTTPFATIFFLLYIKDLYLKGQLVIHCLNTLRCSGKALFLTLSSLEGPSSALIFSDNSLLLKSMG